MSLGKAQLAVIAQVSLLNDPVMENMSKLLEVTFP
jgi:hypothetical protein